jgi:hypothetical protein
LTGGYHLAFWIAGALVAGAIVVAMTVLKPASATASAPVRQPAQEYAEVG